MLKIRTKLLLTMITLTCIIFFIGIYSYTNNLGTHKSYKQLLEVEDLRFYVKSIQFRLTGISNDGRGLLLQGDQSFIDEMKSKTEDIQKYIQIIKSKEGLDDETLQTINKIVANFEVYSAASAKVREAVLSGNHEQAVSIHFGEERNARKELDPIIAKMLTSLDEQTKQQVADKTKRDAILIFVIVAVSVAISIFAGTAVFRSITKPLGVLEKRIRDIAQGDLTGDEIRIQNRDEIGHVLESSNKMVHDLRTVIKRMSISAQNVSAAAQQISATTEQIAGGSNVQAESAQSMTKLFQELSTAVHSVANNAEQAAQLSESTVKVAKDGGKVLSVSIEGMNGVSVQMSKLQEDSNRIGEIIEVIDEIAEQTNLLALNAAIEAARAGDQGRGFAVVADEVRKLAERSGEATKQITNIIRGIQDSTEQSVKAVLEGVSSSRQTGEAFEKIITMVSDTANKVTEIASASDQQAAQASQVMAAVENIAATSEQSAAAAEETASTSQSLAKLAEDLNESVSSFQIK